MASEGADGAEAHGATSLLRPQPEKKLNSFVRAVTLIERLGNALGTLAFTWATVVLLGGYQTVLRSNEDFGFVTIIVFLEATRMFTRDNRMDYQLFFRSRGALRPLGWSGLTVVVMLSASMVLLDLYQWKLSPGLAWVRGLIEALKLGLLILSAELSSCYPSRYAVPHHSAILWLHCSHVVGSLDSACQSHFHKGTRSGQLGCARTIISRSASRYNQQATFPKSYQANNKYYWSGKQ
ncbi:hypothetical protein U9M48_014286 [Paspalum notatum var. saurae]|uniref:Uncharacterized protein n=1 Tax=Paspalum notatum var. saurae TaxID=547442 RepID=A0AAQ3T3Y3_PASNO